MAALGGYDVRTGFEVSYAQCRQSIELAMQNVQWRGLVLGTEANICSMEEALASLKTMKNAEGYVIRWPNGTRVKVKCEEYILLHKAISNLSPLSVWEAMCLGTMVEMRERLPEELWPTFDEYAGKLDDAYWHIVTDVLELHSQTFEMSPKELGLALKAGNTFSISDPSNAKFIWEYRKYKNEASQPPWPNKDAKGWDAVMRKIRPTANKLEE